MCVGIDDSSGCSICVSVNVAVIEKDVEIGACTLPYFLAKYRPISGLGLFFCHREMVQS